MTNDRFEVQFRFDGRLAASGRLDGSDHEAVTSGARRLPAVHAHCFLHRKLPSAAVAEGNGYHVQHAGSRSACHIDYWEVVIGLAAISSALYPIEIRNTIDGCASFLRASLRSVVNGDRCQAEFLRIEPVLEMSDGNRAPIIDLDAEIQAIRRELHDLTARVLYEGGARPVGRSADRLSIFINGEPAAEIDEAVKMRLLQDDIAVALGALKSRGAFARYPLG